MTLPGCFGVFWEAIASNPDCNEKCGARDECKAKFATETLVKYQRELGDAATPHSLSELTGVKPEAILLAINYQQSLAKSQPQAPQRSPVQEAPPPAPGEAAPSDWDPEEVEEEGVAPPSPSSPEDFNVPVPPPVGEPAPVDAPTAAPVEPIVEDPPQAMAQAPADQSAPKVKRPPRKKAASKTKEAAPRKKAAPTTKKSEPGGKKSTKKSPGKKATSKKKSPPKKKGTTSNFRGAGAASRAAAPAKRQTAKRVSRAKAPVGSRTWSPEHNLDRFKRERKRSPLIRRLKQGYVLNREFPMGSGINHRVVVEKDNYKYRGKKYPTLYSVVKAIMGTKPHKKQLRSDGTRPRGTRELISWSAAKFFGLAKNLLTLEEERRGQGKESGRKRRKKK